MSLRAGHGGVSLDSNLNGDSAGIALFQPRGIPITGTDVTALTRLPAGTGSRLGSLSLRCGVPSQYQPPNISERAWSARRTRPQHLAEPNTNNLDLAVYKDLNFGERYEVPPRCTVWQHHEPPSVHPWHQSWPWAWGQRCTGFNSCCSTSSYRIFANPGNADFNIPKRYSPATLGPRQSLPSSHSKLGFAKSTRGASRLP